VRGRLKDVTKYANEHGESAEKQQSRLLAAEAGKAIASGDPDVLHKCQEALKDLGGQILVRQPWFWMGWFGYLEGQQLLMRDQALAQQLLVQGRRAVNSNDLEALKGAVRQLIGLLPPEKQAEAYDYGQGSTIL
jgi:molecular chaperone DnaK